MMKPATCQISYSLAKVNYDISFVKGKQNLTKTRDEGLTDVIISYVSE
jgi:hypothetical protein